MGQTLVKMDPNPLSKFTFDRIARSNKMTLLKLLYEIMWYQRRNVKDEPNILETAITSILHDNAKDKFEIVHYLAMEGAVINKEALVMAIRAYDQSDFDATEKVRVYERDPNGFKPSPSDYSPSLALVVLLINGLPLMNIDGADVTGKLDDGETILMLALKTTYYNHDEKANNYAKAVIVRELVQNGADVTAVSPNGTSVLDIARRNAPERVYNYLLREVQKKRGETPAPRI